MKFKKGNIPWMKGKHHTEESNRKNSEKHKGKITWNKGKQHSETTRKKISLARKGIKLSEKTKKKMSLTHKGDKNYFFGKKHSEETKRKLSEANKGKVPWNKGKYHTEETKKKIRESRKNWVCPIKDTKIEVKIQNFLKQLEITFFTHQYIKIEHGYQCDILIPSMNLVIECDGDYWHKYPVGNDIDHIRTSELLSKGFKVLRLWEREIRVMELNDFKQMLSE